MSYVSQPLVNASIVVMQGATTIATLTTDGDGNANATLNAGVYTVTVSHADFADLTFTLTVSPTQSLVDFKFLVMPKHAVYPVASETMSYIATVTITPTITEAMTEAPTVTPSSLVTETLVLTETAGINPTTWYITCVRASNDVKYLAGTISPSDGLHAESGAVTVSASSGQYCILQSLMIDGVTVVSVGTSDLKSAHNAPAISPLNGTYHLALAQYVRGYEVNISSTTTDGTWEIVEGNGKSFTQNIGGGTCKWYLDATLVYTGTSYTLPAQTVGTIHTLYVSH